MYVCVCVPLRSQTNTVGDDAVKRRRTRKHSKLNINLRPSHMYMFRLPHRKHRVCAHITRVLCEAWICISAFWQIIREHIHARDALMALCGAYRIYTVAFTNARISLYACEYKYCVSHDSRSVCFSANRTHTHRRITIASSCDVSSCVCRWLCADDMIWYNFINTHSACSF